MKPECCFCDRAFGTWQGLAEHLIHSLCAERRVAGRRVYVDVPRSGPCILVAHCWCLGAYDIDTLFARHLEACGG
ncbi:MAG: hypothetical protein L0Z62_08030, partial [Gemmataceae bacterium]|nr:hypothetical protein [Gemmataceae bacterium]